MGLVYFGNTCYINSVLQALYFCKPFREKILEYKAKNKRTKETLLACLADLFYSIATQKKKVGSIAPKKFIARFRKENGVRQGCVLAPSLVNACMDWVLDKVVDQSDCGASIGNTKITDLVFADDAVIFAESLEVLAMALEALHEEAKPLGLEVSWLKTKVQQHHQENTWVHEIFQAVVTRELRCLNCEAVRSTDEVLNNLSVEVHQNTSITHCLRCFFSTETISAENKVLCENCCSLQEHQKRTRVKKLPTILVLHLKRFQFLGQYNRTLKLSHRVVFPLELRVFDTSSDAVNPDRLYDLAAVVVHCGTGINRGHYIAIVKSHRFWLLFDDDAVDKIDPAVMEEFYGLTSELQKSSETGYILFYQSRDPT
ncbi:Ubiquitin carboxyl-terminal hydrolase 46 [Chionoecetes opilio]|uniref:ubiquitinyl hydrolase 1 n=1 Tax=Chionoecetes opilio TaxID=41210 RepID=A0A8J4XTC8_CHIOP|nr:Ubiquitin carboxyl-terminal hydrolase 46 [Chionoecetes opilio]